MPVLSSSPLSLLKRQTTDPDGDLDPYSSTGFAIHYAIIGIVIVLLLLYFLIGFYHARRRIARGQPPLSYHRWMVRRIYPYPYAAAGAPGMQAPPMENGVPLQRWRTPPPTYNRADAPPPEYIRPEGASKVFGDQEFGREGGAAGPAVAVTVVAEPERVQQRGVEGRE